MHPSRARGLLLLCAVAFLALLGTIALWISGPDSAGPPPRTAEHAGSSGGEASEAAEVGRESAHRPGPTFPERAPVPEADPAPVDPLSDRIEGRVVGPDGAAGPAGMTVIARRRGRARIDPDIIAGVLAGDPSIPVARTGVDGAFALAGLEPGATYLLCAAGAGYVARTSDLEVRTGTKDAAVPVSRLYGIALQLREAGGGWPRSDVDLAPRPPPSFGRADPYSNRSLLGLVGVDLSPYQDGPGRRLLLYTTHQDPPVIPGVAVRVHLAGYAPVEATLDVPPILPAIGERTLTVEPQASGWGEIVVRFVDGRDPAVGAPGSQPFRIDLAPEHGEAMSVELPRTPGEKRVRGVPFGRYGACVRNALRQPIFPSSGGETVSIEVGATPVELTVSLAGTAELEAVFEEGDGPGYDGSATFRLTKGHRHAEGGPGAAGGIVLFEQHPYVIGGLVPGPYTLSLEDPPGSIAGSPSNAAHLDLEPGSSTRVRLALR